jgi:hypothetical protein
MRGEACRNNRPVEMEGPAHVGRRGTDRRIADDAGADKGLANLFTAAEVPIASCQRIWFEPGGLAPR